MDTKSYAQDIGETFLFPLSRVSFLSIPFQKKAGFTALRMFVHPFFFSIPFYQP